MLKTFGLELISLVNSDPAWKVSKGSRSASRRARRTVGDSLKNSTGQVRKNPEASVMPVSESEKRGASMVDSHFSEKAEYVPIKKRRFLLRSSPPPQPPSAPVISSELTEVTASLTKVHDTSNKLVAAESASDESNVCKLVKNTIGTNDKKPEMADKSFGEDEDFSGIDILAAAACSSSWGGECGNAESNLGAEKLSVQEHAHEVSTITEARSSSRGLLKEDIVNSSEISTGGTSSCVSTEPVGGLASISTTVKSCQNITAGEGLKDASLKVDSLSLSNDSSGRKDEETAGLRKTCSRDDRSHWDLNVVMDAWEHPFESPKGHNDVPYDMHQGAGKHDLDDDVGGSENFHLEEKLATTYAAHNFVLPGDSRTLGKQNLEDNMADHSTQHGRDVSKSGFDEKPQLSDCNNNIEVVKCTGEDSKTVCYDRTVKSPDNAIDTASNPATCSLAFGTVNEHDNVSVQSLKLNASEHVNGRPVLEDLNLSTSGRQSASENLQSVCASKDMQSNLSVSSSLENQREEKPNLAVLGNTKASSESPYTINAIAGKDALETSKPSELAHIVSDRINLPGPSVSVVAHNSPSTLCKLQADSEVQNDGNVQGKNLVFGNDGLVKFSEASILSKEKCDAVAYDTLKGNLDKGSNCSDKIEAAKANENVADVSCRPVSSVGVDSRSKLPEDFDSQYEDGEVREPSEHPWEGCDGGDREAEHVDYEPDDMEVCSSIDCPVSELANFEDGESCGTRVAAVDSAVVSNVVKEAGVESSKPIANEEAHEQANKGMLDYASEEKMKTSGTKEPLEGRSTSSDMDIALSDDNGGKDRVATHPETNLESKPFRRGLQSRIEGPVTHDTSSQEERLHKMEFRYEESSSMRCFERPRMSFHNQARRQQGDSWNSFRGNRRGGLRRHYSPIMHRHAKLDEDAMMERDDIGYVGVQDDGSYSHQIHPRNRSGADEDDYTGLHSRYKPNRAFSPGRPSTFGRGRSIRYNSFMDERGGRGRYSGASPDESFLSSLSYRRPLSRRERSFSPSGGRAHSNAHHSRGKSPSQSRSRSPIMWNSSRGRLGAGSGGSTFVRQRSRSPNFRTDVRMQRLRSGHHQPDFGPDHNVGFRSMPRSQGSPPHGRWNSSGKEEMGHFREFGYKQRTTGLDRSPGRIRSRGDRTSDLKPDGYYRISDDASGRGEENYEGRNKHYGPLRLARRSYEDGIAGRLHQDIDDSYSIAKGIRDRDAEFQSRGFRGRDSRINDLPRRFRGEQHSFMCDRDGKLSSTSKQFGVDVTDPSHNMNSEEQYRSSRVGRFSDVEGINLGRRYDNFAERRRHYDPTNSMKRADAEGSEKRSNHNSDENFRDGPEFFGRGMRNFDGRVGGHSARLREDKDSAVCGQENKLEDNSQ